MDRQALSDHLSASHGPPCNLSSIRHRTEQVDRLRANSRPTTLCTVVRGPRRRPFLLFVPQCGYFFGTHVGGALTVVHSAQVQFRV
jgi:hypothetical protein